jgi:LemA protein
MINMPVWTIVLIVIIILIVLWAIGVQNSLVKKRMQAENAFADIDVQLVKRYDLIPNIVNTVKGYAKHEKETLEEVINARNKAVNAGNINDKVDADNEVTGAISKLFALTESYPELKANENFLNLQTDLEKIETELASARKYYNAASREYNYAINVIPSNIVAKIFGHKKMEMFSANEDQRKNVKVEF